MPGRQGGGTIGARARCSGLDAQRVLVAGAGVAGLETALALRALAGDRVSVEVISPEPLFAYRPAAVAEPFGKGAVRRFPLERLVAAAGARFRHDLLVEVDDEQKSVRLNSGDSLEYGMLVVAAGARPVEAVPGALTFRGAEDGTALSQLLERTLAGELRRFVFVVPTGVSWTLPLYELALLTSEFLVDHLTRGVELVLVTAEKRPLEIFGEAASEAITRLLTMRGIRLETGRHAHDFQDGKLRLADGAEIAADAAVAAPRLRGRVIEGLPQDDWGFIPTDEFGRVNGLSDVYAAGDLTQTPIKQGGVAAQQADAVAGAIAAELGAPVQPAPARPVLRGLLLTGSVPKFIRSEPGAASEVTSQPLWWPPAKLVGRYLSPFLAEQLGISAGPLHEREGDVAIDIAVDTHTGSAV
jgi:sulfide:quinone oxidoreductase